VEFSKRISPPVKMGT